MSQPDAWRRESVALALGLSFICLIGLWAGLVLEFLAVGLAGYLVWHLRQMHYFTRWLDSPKNCPPPAAVGIWRPLLQGVDALRDRGRKRKRKLSRMLGRFQESTGALPDATIVLDDKGQVEWYNGAARGMLGLSRRRGKGKRIDDLITDPIFHAYLVKADYNRPLKMPAPVDDSANLEMRIVPYGKGKRLLQARDISRLQQLETVRRDFVANVSHEMRTPLTVIYGYLEAMSEHDSGELSPWQHIIDQMRQQTSRMQRTVEDLLLLSRLENVEQTVGQEVVGVANLLQNILAEARNLSGGEHVIDLDEEKYLDLYGNSNEFDSAISNLVFNAVRYTPAGGSIHIRWRNSQDGPCFSVADNGIGIAPEHIPRLTERFYRVDVGRSRSSGGTGLGLAIVKHVMLRHGGQLKIESKPGEGSTFTCCFPSARARDTRDRVCKSR